jgi:hypothetical protein
VNIHKAGGRVQYYYKKSSDDKVRRYLKESEKKLVKKLCQKDYDQRVLASAQKELKLLEKFQKIYEGQICEEIYESLNEHRQIFVDPIWLPDEKFVENWESVRYQAMGFKETSPEYYTDKGERVRSKSEILIANALKKHNITYRYEYALGLKGDITLHPDFTVLNVRKRQELYWEHFGMMDDPQYVESAMKKIETYEKNGIFPGETLIMTFESKGNPINQSTVKLLIEKYMK